MDVLDRASSHKWLGCLLHAGGCHDADIDFHLQAALRAFNANRWILIDRHVSLATRLRYFDTIITPVACFAAGHRMIFKKDLNKIHVTFRKLLRSMVGPPAATDWSRARGAKGTVVLGSHFLSLCAEPERLRCIAFI